MTAKTIERVAFIAAHRILEAQTNAPQLVCAGAHRSYAVDKVAGIMREAFELSILRGKDWRLYPKASLKLRPHLVPRYSEKAILELRLRDMTTRYSRRI